MEWLECSCHPEKDNYSAVQGPGWLKSFITASCALLLAESYHPLRWHNPWRPAKRNGRGVTCCVLCSVDKPAQPCNSTAHAARKLTLFIVACFLLFSLHGYTLPHCAPSDCTMLSAQAEHQASAERLSCSSSRTACTKLIRC